MTRLTRAVRSYWWVIAAVVLLVALGLVIAFASRSTGDTPQEAALKTFQAATPVPTASVDQDAVNFAVNRFVNALADGNADALYALQTDAYKQSCSRQDFTVVAASLTRQTLRGPVTAAIRGDRAVAQLFKESGQEASLTLQKAADGTWRIVATATNGCS